MSLWQSLYAEAAFRLATFTWLGVLDLLLVTLAFYLLLKLVQRSRAALVIRGVLVLGLLLFAITIVLPLPTFDWLMRGALVVMLIAIPIMFQPELRRLLERVGRNAGLTRSVRQTGAENLVNLLVRALENLSNTETGALIALEGNHSLQEMAQTGVPFGGQVTSELLQNIFYPGTPLHDGAVVIREDRVVAAGCVLPITQRSPRSRRRLGMRHRAAIGLSEVSDALVLIVSEETGDISAARYGELRRGLDSAELREQLVSFYVSPEAAPTVPSLGELLERARQALFKAPALPGPRTLLADAGLLAVSFFLALITWWFVVGQVNPARRALVEDIDLRVVEVPPGVALMAPPPSKVAALIQTTDQVLPALSPSAFQAVVSLRELAPGLHRVPIRVSSSMSQVRVLQITPEAVDLELAPLVTQTMEVRIEVAQLERLSPGYELAGDLSASPERVQVVGPQPLVERVSRVQGVVSAGNLTESQREMLPLQALDESGRLVEGVRLVPDWVWVSLSVRRQPNTRQVGVRAVLSGEPPAGYWVSGLDVFPANVTLQGEPDRLDELDSFLDTLPIDVSQALGDLDVRVPLDLPSDVQALDARGNLLQTVRVLVQVSPRQGNLVVTRPIEVLAVSPGLEFAVTPASLDVLLEGPLPVLNGIEADPSLVRVLLDPSGLAPGQSAALAPSVVAPAGVESQLVPPTVFVEATE